MGVLMVVLLLGLVGENATLREMAQRGAFAFTIISFGQVLLICLLTPVFMSGAIAQEANASTWDILLTSPLNALQIVLGNLFGRLFFILALLVSTLPVFAVTQFFGGVPGETIFESIAVAGCSALVVAAIAITLSVTRTAGRRAVFIFYVCIALYLLGTWAADSQLRMPLSPGSSTKGTTFLTPLNPFLAMEALLLTNTYAPSESVGAGWFHRFWYSHPVALFCWLCILTSTILVIYSTLRVRSIGTSAGQSRWRQSFSGVAGTGARAPRRVGNNPIAWWEHDGRGRTLGALVGRWSFVAVGIAAAILVLALYINGLMSVSAFRTTFLTLLAAETVIVILTALNLSATAVSREREDGTLDLILTTPIQPSPYLAGKLRGLIQNLLPMILVPCVSLALGAILVVSGGFGAQTIVQTTIATKAVDVPLLVPESAIIFPFVLIGCTAFCVMVGLHWSIKSRGTIGSVIAALGVVLVIMVILAFCGLTAGRNVELVGPFFASLSPINLLMSTIMPEEFIGPSLTPEMNPGGRIALLVGGVIATAIYIAMVFGMHAAMKRSFMMTVRKLAGTGT